jgi:alkylated DNA repair dioxygenase AlkB
MTMEPNPFDMLASSSQRWVLEDEGISLEYDGTFLQSEDADRLFEAFRKEIPWTRSVAQTPAGPRAVPRMTSWHANQGLTYTYGLIAHAWRDWTPSLLEVRERLASRLGVRFDGVLANLYENERDSVAPHADDERDMQKGAPIASVSLGVVRNFVIRHRTTRSRHVLPLEHGSLLVMRGTTQEVSQHSVPKVKQPCGPRINLTFRQLRA